jgi:hypothetical protein
VEATRDTLKLQEERAMGKRLRKSEKLDLILTEVAKLRAEVKNLIRDRAAVVAQGGKDKPRSVPGLPKKLPKQTGFGKKPDRDAAPSKSLVQVQVPQPTSRTASQ